MIEHPLAATYTRPGGPWDVPSLDHALPPDPALEPMVATLAGGLLAAGIAPGDRVAWQLPNRAEAAALYRACWRVGAVAVPIHHRATEAEVQTLLTEADGAHLVRGEQLPDGRPVAPGALAIDPASAAVVLFTSGTSGHPKGVVHTHRGLVYKARLMVDVHGLGPNDAVLMPAPLAHISGLLNGVLLPAVAGMRSVLMPRWEPGEALALIEQERITFMAGPPTFFVDLWTAAGFHPDRVRSLRLISSGGAGITPAFVDEASSQLGCFVKRTYGSTEAPTVTTAHAGDPAERARDTDGRPIGDAELRLDPSNGEVQVRGPEVFVGYTDPRRDEAVLGPDGWFRTGDVGTIADDGWLTIVGRIKDIIIRGGENIAASEVEGVLEAHEHVVQAVAVGYPDERLGERVAAVVVVANGTFDLDACRTWFESRGVARYKTPERVVVVEALPLLASGKPDREALRRDLSSPDSL